MIRKLLATTALASLIATGAIAQETVTPAPQPEAPVTQDGTTMPAVEPADGFLATNLIGESVYNGTADDAENIGNVNDLVLDNSGSVEAVVVGVGGFLGIGEKNVALNFSDMAWAERDGDRWIVVNATKEQLEAFPDFDRRPYDVVTPVASDGTATQPTDTTAMAPAAPAPADDSTAMAPAVEAPADATAPAMDSTAQDGTAMAPDQTQTSAIDRSTLTEVATADIRSEDLVGTTVYGANDENVGEIGDVVLSTDGKVDAVIIDVGGFLGIGEKEVAVGMDNLAFMRDGDNAYYLYTNFSKEQLEAQAAYDEGTYTENRDTQRLIMTR